MTLATYQPVTADEWGTDMLDGKQVFGGTKVNVRWPDGTTSTHVMDYYEAGVKWKSKIVYDLCILVKVKGLDVKVPVRNSPLLLVRVD